ncbi:MAG: family 2 glycosyl transferase, partial [Cellulosilyticaceae bacterium]
MNRYLKIFTLIIIIIIFICTFGLSENNSINANTEDGVMQVARTNAKDIEIYKNGKWEKTFLKGVNIGSGKPGYFPGEFGIEKKEYKKWFKQIQEMNSNVIRVYTLQMPDFYEALYEHNKNNKNPLYLMHGVWVDEDAMLETLDAFTPQIIDTFKAEIGKIIDVLHGNASIDKVVGRGYGKYKKDVSEYVLGYILGVEWDPYFVKETNEKYKGMKDYNGKWLYTENANPIEIFLADSGNYAIDYEATMYDTQKIIAFTNWLTTDVIDHQDEIEEANRIANIDESKIKSKESFKSGLFVSYHVYPYYPDFLNTDEKYTGYKDENGKQNAFKAYLDDLITYFEDRPVIISEFGVPTSRGIAHEDESRGFNQGMIEERNQGEMNKELLQDIHSTGYAGAIIFSWQDEWFKRTWNTMDITENEGRAYWSDKMTNEQSFGLLTFDPGENKSVSYVDGNIKEWKNKDIVSENENMKIYMKSDEAYVYFRINKKNLDLNNEEIMIPIDITEKSGSKKINGYDITFNENADFII